MDNKIEEKQEMVDSLHQAMMNAVDLLASLKERYDQALNELEEEKMRNFFSKEESSTDSEMDDYQIVEED